MNHSFQPRTLRALEVTEGAGVNVHRSIGIPALRNLDPFMLLDHIGSDDPDEYLAGFPSHPHRGFITFTYMIDGDMEHKDSMGNTGNLGPGGAQWMKAASGVIHSEMPKQENGLMRGFQLWINLPAAHKMDAPEYQEYTGEAFPVVRTRGYEVRVLIGSHAGAQSPIVDDLTQVSYFDISIQAGETFSTGLEDTHNSFAYVFEGNAELEGKTLPQHSLTTLKNTQMAKGITAGARGARLLLVSGKPINESVVQYGPFVMNTREEIDQALNDFHSNQFVKDRAWINRQQPARAGA